MRRGVDRWPGSAKWAVAGLAAFGLLMVWVNLTTRIEGPWNEWIEWGAAGEWAGAGITATAIGLGVWQFNKTHLLDRASLGASTAESVHRREFAAARSHREAAENAGRVYGQIVFEYESAPNFEPQSDDPVSAGMRVDIFNTSGRPVTGAIFRLLTRDRSGSDDPAKRDAANDTILATKRLGAIPPSIDGEPTLRLPLQITEGPGSDDFTEFGLTDQARREDVFVAELFFRDPGGLLWLRPSDGPPRRVESAFLERQETDQGWDLRDIVLAPAPEPGLDLRTPDPPIDRA